MTTFAKKNLVVQLKFKKSTPTLFFMLANSLANSLGIIKYFSEISMCRQIENSYLFCFDSKKAN